MKSKITVLARLCAGRPVAFRRVLSLVAGVGLLGVAACSGPPPEATGLAVAPSYNRDTGRLEKLTADQDGDGKQDTVALMDGSQIKSIEIDRDNDGHADRWEYYEPAASGAGTTAFDRRAVIVRADEVSRPGGPINRREFYEHGALQRVEEDVNNDGRVDKWEYYDNGLLTRVDVDLAGKGTADRRFVYAANGDVVRIEQDPDGDGKFSPMPATP